jgi:hypothetical protein
VGASGTARRIIQVSRCLLAGLALLILVAVPARAATTGSIGLRLLDAPTTDDPRARLYIVDHLAPGTTIDRRIEISNTSGSTQPVVLYAGAASIEKGSFIGAEGRTANEVSSWTTVTPGTLDVASGGVATATVTIAVPANAPPGEQYGVIWAETRSEERGEGGVTQVNRVGIRIYLSVGPGGAPAADFTIDSLTAERTPEGRPMVSATVHNTGGRALDMHGELRLLDGPGGLSAGPFPATLGTTLAVGDTESVTILLDEELPPGPWDAQIRMESGLLEHRAHAVITFPDAGAAAPVHIDNEGLPWALLIAGGIGLILLLGLIALFVRRSRRARVRTLRPQDGRA